MGRQKWASLACGNCLIWPMAGPALALSNEHNGQHILLHSRGSLSVCALADDNAEDQFPIINSENGLSKDFILTANLRDQC